jgi:hypothetical protein
MRVGTRTVVVIALAGLSCATVREVRVRPDTLCAEGAAGSLTVRVTDAQGLTLPGATISLRNSSGDVLERVTVGKDSVALFLHVPQEGVCRIRGELTGFEVTTAGPFPCSPKRQTSVSLPMRVDMRNAVTFS